MSEILILPDEISNRIAAGEVVDRPASVVKELVENAIDAGATAIGIEVRRAGSKLIAVTDDGKGMDAEDALLSLEPHGTSKIKSAADIERIVTLGFRGEALPSIASVSKLKLKTRRKADPEGLEIEVEGGKVKSSRPSGGAPGTRIEVADLFFNTPARRKFLRSAATEELHIQETVIMLALPYPGVGFELSFDNRVLFRSPAGRDLRGRLREFFGKASSERYLEVEGETGGIRVSGFIAPPDWTRSSRREQRTFVNGRMVDSPAIYRGIREGYGERGESGRFPPVALFIELEPGEFDINVHPTKKEVRFRNENAVADAVAKAISATLRGTPGPSLKWEPNVPLDALLAGATVAYEVPVLTQPELPAGRDPAVTDRPQAPAPPPLVFADAVPAKSGGVAEAPPPAAEELPDEARRTLAPEVPRGGASPIFALTDGNAEALRLIGIFDKCYLLIELDGELLIVDQHAAHERILFERLLARRDAATIQQLLLPVNLELDRRTAQFLERHRKSFAELGFDLAELSSRSIMVNGVPADLPNDIDLERLVLDIFEILLENSGSGAMALPLETVARAACRAAVKARDLLSHQEGEALLRDLVRCARPDCCPHGRPTVIKLGKRELMRRFGRLG